MRRTPGPEQSDRRRRDRRAALGPELRFLVSVRAGRADFLPPIPRADSGARAVVRTATSARSRVYEQADSANREAGMKRTLASLVPAAVVSAVLVIAGVAVAASSPAVTTGTHSNVTDTTAVLHATVDPNGSATTYYFQWGLTTAYGVQSTAHSAGHGTKAKAVSTTAT